jgi:hypothetical protein
MVAQLLAWLPAWSMFVNLSDPGAMKALRANRAGNFQ